MLEKLTKHDPNSPRSVATASKVKCPSPAPLPEKALLANAASTRAGTSPADLRTGEDTLRSVDDHPEVDVVAHDVVVHVGDQVRRVIDGAEIGVLSYRQGETVHRVAHELIVGDGRMQCRVDRGVVGGGDRGVVAHEDRSEETVTLDTVALEDDGNVGRLESAGHRDAEAVASRRRAEDVLLERAAGRSDQHAVEPVVGDALLMVKFGLPSATSVHDVRPCPMPSRMSPVSETPLERTRKSAFPAIPVMRVAPPITACGTPAASNESCVSPSSRSLGTSMSSPSPRFEAWRV